MEKKPLKRSLNIVSLSQEHHYSLLFSWKIKNGLEMGVSTERILRYVRYFWEHHLRQHFKQEEDVLFRTVKDIPLVTDVLRGQKEAATIIQGLLRNTENEDNTRETLAELAEKMKTLVRKEERRLFPDLEKHFSEDELKNISNELRKWQPQHLEDNYDDEFWEKDKS